MACVDVVFAIAVSTNIVEAKEWEMLTAFYVGKCEESNLLRLMTASMYQHNMIKVESEVDKNYLMKTS